MQKKMIKEEFLKKVNNYGIDLNSFFIVIGHEPKWMYYTGIYQDNKDWVIYEVDERNEATVVYKGTEEKAFSELYSMLLGRISRKGFVNESITKDIIQTSKQDVDSFLQRKYAISKQDAENTWNYLKWDFHVLNELKYFALRDQFVSVDDCYKVHGYSAENIANNKINLIVQDKTHFLYLTTSDNQKILLNTDSEYILEDFYEAVVDLYIRILDCNEYQKIFNDEVTWKEFYKIYGYKK